MDISCKTAVNWVTRNMENGLENSTLKMGDKVDKMPSHISSNMAYCEIPHKGVDQKHHLQLIAVVDEESPVNFRPCDI
jgi:hypothetical protein